MVLVGGEAGPLMSAKRLVQHFTDYFSAVIELDLTQSLRIQTQQNLMSVLEDQVVTEFALKDRELILQVISELTNDVLWDWDLKTDTVTRNSGFDRLLGYQPGEFESGLAGWARALHADDEPYVRESIKKAIDSGGSKWECDYRMRRKDGTYIHIHDTGFLFRDENGKAFRFVGGSRDISDLVRYQEELKRQADVFDQAQEAILILELDGRVRSWNKSAERIYGWSRDEVMGRSIQELFGPDSQALLDGVAHGSSHRAFTMDWAVKNRRGEELTVEVHQTPVRSEAGTAEAIISIHFDVTQRRRDEEQLRLLEACFSRVNDVVLITEADPTPEIGYKVVFANPAFERVTGYSTEEILGRSLGILFGPETSQEEVDRIAGALRRWESVRSEILTYRRSGEPFWTELTISPVADESGWYTHWVSIHRDITSEKLAKQRLEEHQKLIAMASRIGRLGAWAIEIPSLEHRWSDECRAIHGADRERSYELDELIDFYVGEYRDQIRREFSHCAQSGEGFDGEYLIRKESGQEVWVRVTAEAEVNEKGEVIRVQGTMQDIDDWKRAEESIAASEGRFRALAESMPNIVWTATPDGVIDYVSSFFYSYTGIPEIGGTEEQWKNAFDSDLWEELEALWQNSVETRGDFEIDIPVKRAEDGVFRWFRIQAKPIFNPLGELVKWFGAATDIDDTRQLIAQSDRLASRLNEILETISDAYFILDRDWKFNYLNRQAEVLLRRKRETLIGKNVWEEFAPAKELRFFELYQKAMADGESVSFEEFYPPLQSWFDLRAYPSQDGIVVYFRDITEKRAAAEEVRVNEERFRLLARASNDALYDWDIRSDYIWWSPALTDLFGHTRKDVGTSVKGWADRIHQADRERVLASMDSAINSKRLKWEADYRYYKRDGTLAYVHGRAYVLRDDQGSAIRLIGGMTDISDRYAQQARIAEQASLIAVARDAISVRDLKGSLLFANESAKSILALKPSGDDAQLRIHETLSVDERYWNAVTDVQRSGHWQGELEVGLPSGESVILDCRWTLLRNDDGQPKSILAIETDITDRKRAEARLMVVERRLQEYLDDATDLVQVVDLHGRIQYANKAWKETLGFSEDQLAVLTITDVLAPESWGVAESFLSTPSAQIVRVEFQTILRGKVSAEGSVEPVLENGIQVGTRAILKNITERIQAEADLQTTNELLEERVARRTRELAKANAELMIAKEAADAANRSKTEFLSRISHELRTPLNAILGFSQLLDFTDLTPSQADSVAHIEKAGKHLLDLINDVLEISRAEIGGTTASLQVLDASAILRECLAIMRPIAETSHVILLSSSVPPVFVQGDRQKLRQIFMNLLSNGIKFNRRGGSLTVHHDLSDPEVLTIRFQDTGLGIPGSKMDRLFKPFERLGSANDGTEGTGLGLAVSRSLAGSMGGSLDGESEEGIGSTFTLKLKIGLQQEESSFEGPGKLSVPSQDSVEPCTVLAVEDNVANMELLAKLFANRKDVKMLVALDGSSALRLARKHRPDAILLDLHLPDMDGEEVITTLKAEKEFQRTPFIIVTADAREELPEKFAELGAYGFLTKPLDLKELIATLNEAIKANGRRSAE
jgi:PAS domain S-box-containing protein